MNSASIAEIRKELGLIHPERLIQLCLSLAKYKKENKELLGYLLFDADDERLLVQQIKIELDSFFAEMNTSTVFYAKKTLRKILRIIGKYIAFSGSKRLEVELLLYFCAKMKASGLNIDAHAVLRNMYQRQIIKISKAMKSLHEDLQADFADELQTLV